ncbi:MAG: alpha/beta hydrolase [Methanobacteriota archaeon]
MENLRTYGTPPFTIAVIHGGPGAPGEMAPVARELAHLTGVLEPLQTATTIEQQVEELKTILKKKTDIPIILIGWSWGAWLSFLFTTQHPTLVKKLIIISSGPFEERYATDITKTRLSRLTTQEKIELNRIMNTLNNPSSEEKNNSFIRLAQLFFKTDSYDPLPHKNEILEYQYDIYENIWKQAVILRENGTLLESGKKILCPVVAIHGDYDPHPYLGVKKSLTNIIKDFRFILLKNCGHYPWIEKAAQNKFYTIIKNEIQNKRQGNTPAYMNLTKRNIPK